MRCLLRPSGLGTRLGTKLVGTCQIWYPLTGPDLAYQSEKQVSRRACHAGGRGFESRRSRRFDASSTAARAVGLESERMAKPTNPQKARAARHLVVAELLRRGVGDVALVDE